MTGRSKSGWTPEAKKRAFDRLKETQKRPVSYARKKQLIDDIPDTLPRY